MHRVAVKKNYICNAQKRTNYMFRPFLQLSEELYYNTI